MKNAFARIKSPYLEVPDDRSDHPEVDLFTNFSDSSNHENESISRTDAFASASDIMPRTALQTPYFPDDIQELEEQFLGNLKDLFKQWGKNK